jgi:hypothetical protein
MAPPATGTALMAVTRSKSKGDVVDVGTRHVNHEHVIIVYAINVHTDQWLW